MSVQLRFDEEEFSLEDAIAIDFYLDNVAGIISGANNEKKSGEELLTDLVTLAASAYHVADVFISAREGHIKRALNTTSTIDESCSATNPST